MAAALAVSGCGGGSVGQKTYTVPSTAMEPTLAVGERINIDTLAYRNAKPKPGEIVVFHPPEGAASSPPRCGVAQTAGQLCSRPTPQPADLTFIKRIVAGPGDRIAMIDGNVLLNGHRQNETSIRACTADEASLCSFPRSIIVPAGLYFVVGDNRAASDDSRFWGPVPKTWIVGKVLGH